ncbi:hypothetical protein DFH09DRAFT_1278594 [Mycena vulgaris]|nr:hypothetical protein DFH09DRAFT_1278594 [Mycena vulgaris]
MRMDLILIRAALNPTGARRPASWMRPTTVNHRAPGACRRVWRSDLFPHSSATTYPTGTMAGHRRPDKSYNATHQSCDFPFTLLYIYAYIYACPRMKFGPLPSILPLPAMPRTSHPLQGADASAPTEDIPASLARPADWSRVDDVARPTIAMMQPGLAKLPGYMIRHQLVQISGQLLSGLDDVQLPTTLPKNDVPEILQTPRPRHPGYENPFFPTHVVALIAPLTVLTPPDAPVPMVAIHGTVLAAHCATTVLPHPIHHLAPQYLSLPVVRLEVPSMTAFTLLRAYMYSGRVDTFLESLIPLPSAIVADIRRGRANDKLAAVLAAPAQIHQLTQHVIFSTFGGVPEFWVRVRQLYAVWETMYELAMSDSLLWQAFDLAWLLARNALQSAIEHQKDLQDAARVADPCHPQRH